MSDVEDDNKRLLSLLVCWGVHAGLLIFIGLAGLGMGLLGDSSSLLAFWAPMFGAAMVPFANLIDLMSAGAMGVLLGGLAVGVVSIGGFLRTGWGRGLLLACTWLHIVGLIPFLLLIHLRVGLGGVVGVIFLLAELGMGVVTVVVLKGSLKIIHQTQWKRG